MKDRRVLQLELYPPELLSPLLLAGDAFLNFETTLSKMEFTNSSCIRNNFPVVIKNKIKNWKMLNYTKEDWCNVFNDKLLKFRQGHKTFSETPHWEHLCKTIEIKLNTFFELSTKNSDHWLYFDYKYVKDVFPETEPFIKDINWADVGLFDMPGEESALWIGNEGAHTPCHKDTYGCNLVAQLFGRKLWILMPPEEIENLEAVRVPYEESSVYSSFNFYTPNKRLLSIKDAYKVVLCPGDVLYVPRHWWHYVENLEPAISTNIWIPLDEDHESRLEESLIQYYISNICRDLSEEEAKQILNPSEHSLLSQPCTISLIGKCLENYKNQRNQSQKQLNEEMVQILSRFQGETAAVDKLCMESFIKEKTALHNQNKSNGNVSQNETSSTVSIVKTLINAYCLQSNINLVKKALLEQDNDIK